MDSSSHIATLYGTQDLLTLASQCIYPTTALENIMTTILTEVTANLTEVTVSYVYYIKRFTILTYDKWLIHSVQSIKSQVIQGYLNGKTRDQIATDVGISGGKVSGIIKDWAAEMGKPNVESMRDFATILNKSGISPKQYAEGLRIVQLLKNLGIKGETDCYGGNGNNDSDPNKEIILFIEEIYQSCKRLGISPSIVPAWIRDLLDFYGHGYGYGYGYGHNNNNRNSLASINDWYGQDIHVESEEYCYQQSPDTTKPNKQNPPLDDGVIFISQIPHYIAQKKKEYGMLKADKQDLIKEIGTLDYKKDKAEQNLEQLHQKEKFALSHINLFSKLKKELWVNYEIKIEEDIQSFAQLINDFKSHNFDAFKILNEYLTSLSLKLTIKTDESKVKELEEQITSMQSSFSYWRTQTQIHKQAIDTYNELQAMGFGLDELKRILYAVMEISECKNIPTAEAVSLLIRDVEEHYHDYLLFKDMANSKRNEVQSLKNQINHYRFTLQVSPFVGQALTNLFQNGVSEQDIIEINQLVQDYKNIIVPIDAYSEGKGTKYDKDNKPNEKGFCRSLIDGLKRYGGIKLEIKEHSEKLDAIKQEINDSNRQKQEVLAYCHLAVALTGIINYKISYLKGLLDHYLNELKHNKIKTTSLSPMLIFVIYDNKSNYKEEGEEGEKDGK